MIGLNQCSGSVTFWYGFGTLVGMYRTDTGTVPNNIEHGSSSLVQASDTISASGFNNDQGDPVNEIKK
jgi:hypothetical protein